MRRCGIPSLDDWDLCARPAWRTNAARPGLIGHDQWDLVVGIFPGEGSIVRLIGVVLLEQSPVKNAVWPAPKCVPRPGQRMAATSFTRGV